MEAFFKSQLQFIFNKSKVGFGYTATNALLQVITRKDSAERGAKT